MRKLFSLVAAMQSFPNTTVLTVLCKMVWNWQSSLKKWRYIKTNTKINPDYLSRIQRLCTSDDMLFITYNGIGICGVQLVYHRSNQIIGSNQNTLWQISESRCKLVPLYIYSQLDILASSWRWGLIHGIYLELK